MVCYEKALELSPQDWWALNNIGVLLKKKGKLQDAFRNFDKACNVAVKEGGQDYYHILHNLAWAYYQCKDYEKAWNLYKLLTKECPDKISVYVDFVCVNYKMCKFKEALELLDEALSQHPKNRHCRRLYKLVNKRLDTEG